MQTSNETRIVPASTKDGKPAGSQTQLWREILETVLLTALVYFVVRSSVQLTPIDGPSMQPGLHTGESVLVNELAYLFGSPQRGDVIVFHPPSDPSQPSSDPSQQFIKRVIAVPGDTIQITDTAVIVDGVTLHEPYLNAGDEGNGACGQLSAKLGPGDYFVMGDNRGNSDDSRCFGPAKRDAIVGKAELVIWPFNEFHWIATYHDVFAGVNPIIITALVAEGSAGL